jgi:hypothetical protein
MFFRSEQLIVLWDFLSSVAVGFLITFLGGNRYRKWRDKPPRPFIGVIPGEDRIRWILSHKPDVKANLTIKGNIFTGFKAVTSFHIKNTTGVKLDDLEAKLVIMDLELKKEEKSCHKELVEMLPGEEIDYEMSIKLGRTLKRIAVVLEIRRSAVVLTEFHWTSK